MSIKTVKQPCDTIKSTVNALAETLLDMAENNARFAFVTSDNIDYNGPFGELMRRFPERCCDVGIAEANQIGVSAGLALGGNQVVFSKGFGIFVAQRAADQINLDVGYNGLPVRVIADHCGVTAAGGPTHNMVNDLSIIRAMPGLTIVAPADATETARLVRLSMDYPGPMYFRMTKGIDPVVYDEADYPLEIGKAVCLKEGNDVTLIGSGLSVGWVLQAADLLEAKGISARVLNMHTIKPIDRQAIMEAAEQTAGIITVEDHSVVGGLGAAVTQVLAENGCVAGIKVMGFPDIYMPPEKIVNMYKRYNLTPEAIAESAEKIIANSRR